MTENTRSNLEQQTIALAGVAQAARLVDQISKTGSYPMEFLSPSIHSLFAFDADSVEQVFGGISGVKLGLNNLSSLLASRQADENAYGWRKYLVSQQSYLRFCCHATIKELVQRGVNRRFSATPPAEG